MKNFLFLIALILLGLRIGSALSISTSNTVNGRELPIYSVETNKKQIALTFDAAWGNEDLDSILNTLKQYNVRATFFLTGGWIENYPSDVKRIYEEGHDIGSHSENHKNMSQLSTEDCTSELLTVHKRLQTLLGIETNLFRPPYGDYNNDVINTATACGYYSIQWSVDSLDWKDYGTDSIITTVTNHPELKNGAIILLHNGAKYTSEALPTLIEKLLEKGYEFVPVSELIYKENYHLDITGRQISNQNK